MGDDKQIKRYILDTSVLLHDPKAIFSFEDNLLYLPMEVVGELDKHKTGLDQRNVNAREINRTLEELTREDFDPKEGVSLPNGGRLFFLNERSIQSNYNDDIILAKAINLRKEHPEDQVVLVAKDLNLLLRARIDGLSAQDYKHDQAHMDLKSFFNREVDTLDVGNELIRDLHQHVSVDVPDYLVERVASQLQPNQYLVLREDRNQILAKYKDGKFVIIERAGKVEEILPRNNEQRFLLDACLDEDYRIVAGLGKAGTGKTLMALAAAIHQVTKNNPAANFVPTDRAKNYKKSEYNKVVVFRPMLESGKGLGFLPGSLEDKINPYFQPVNTALQLIMGDAAADYSTQDFIDCRPLNFIRGDTLHNSYVIVDEAQNYTPAELKLIGTRIGDSSKLVLLGDPYQSDNPYLDERSNALSLVPDRFRNKIKEFAYVILNKVERGRVAEIFAEHY